MKFKKSPFFPIVSLFVICLVTSLLVAGAYALTKDLIAENELKTLAESRKAVLEADEYKDAAIEGVAGECAEAVKGGKVIGYVFKESAKGYGGDVVVMVGIDTEGAITGVKIVSHSETPGLGAAFNDEQYLSKFVGGTMPFAKGVVRRTGASITSWAVSQAVNKAFDDYRIVIKGADNK
ncbi:MAG: FMN-binding protein [Clostridia bacterium]|nr:FMN-binding protein [Clostridia bacterium]